MIKINLENILLNRFLNLKKEGNLFRSVCYESNGEDPNFIIKNLTPGIIDKVTITMDAEAGDLIEVYWKDQDTFQFNTNMKRTAKLILDKTVTYDFDINPLKKVVHDIRIDPTNRPGKINIKSLSIRYMDDRLLKVNVGCGPKDQKQGWINVDIQRFPSVDRVMDVTKEWDFKNVSYIYAEHFIEHITLEQAINFLYHAGVSLKEDGWIRLTTPNIEWVLKTHYNFNATSDNDKLNSIYSLNRAFYGWQHRFLYSAFYLKYILSKLGYKEIREKNYGESDIPAFKGIEQHGNVSKYEEYSSIIVIEAKKGSICSPKGLLEQANDPFIKYNRAKG